MTFALVAGLLCVLLFAGLPVAFALGVSGVAGLLATDQSLLVVAESLYSALDDFVLLALPLFIFMSHLLLKAGIGEDIFAVMHIFFRHFPGGLAVAAVASCAFFSAISGSSAATAATIGIVAIPAMIRRGYHPRFAAGLLAAGGTLGILIPPSIPFILYGAITEESVGTLFVAGVVPGLFMAALIAGYAVLASYRGKAVTEPRASWGERWAVVRRGGWAMLLPPAILGGIYAGVFTPTEAAAVGVVLSLVIGAAVYRRLPPRALLEALRGATQTSVMLMAVVAGAKLFGHVTSTMQIPQLFSDWIVGQEIGRWGFLIAVNLVLILLGDFLDPVSIILIVVPVIQPVLQALQIDPIWFGVILVVNMELANITPPVGLNLYVILGIQRDLTFADILRGTAPFMGVIAIGLVILMLFPSLSLWLPQVAG